jgi:hypothetical protein
VGRVDASFGRAWIAEATHHPRLAVRRADRAPTDGENRVDGERHVRARQRSPRRSVRLLAGGEQLPMLLAPCLPAAEAACGGRDDRGAEPHAVVRAHRREERNSTIHQRPGIPLESLARARVVAGLGERQHVQLRNERMTDPRRKAQGDPFAPRIQPDHEHTRVHPLLAHRVTPRSGDKPDARDRA